MDTSPDTPQDVAMSFDLDSHLNVNGPMPQYVRSSPSSTPTHSYDTRSLPDYKEPGYDYVAGFGFRRTPSPGSGHDHLVPSPTQRRTWEVNTDMRMQILSERQDRIESRQSGSEAMQESLDDRMDMVSERQDVDSMRISSIRKDLEEIQDALRNGFRGTWTSDHPAFCRPKRGGRPTGLAKKACAHLPPSAKGSCNKYKHSRDDKNEDEGDAVPCPKRRKPSPSAGTRPVVPPPGDHFSDSDTEMMESEDISVIECATVYAMAKSARPATKGEAKGKKAAPKAPAPAPAPAPAQNNPQPPRHTHPRYGLRNLNQMQKDRERREAAKRAADAARRQEAHDKRVAAKRKREAAARTKRAANRAARRENGGSQLAPPPQQDQQQNQGQNQEQDQEQQDDGQQQVDGQQDDEQQDDGLQNQQQQDSDQENEKDNEQPDERQDEQPDEMNQQDNQAEQGGEVQEQQDEEPQQGGDSNTSDDSRAGKKGGQREQTDLQQDKVEEEKDEGLQQEEAQNTSNKSDDSVDEQVEDDAGGGTIILHQNVREDEEWRMTTRATIPS
ncbi:hypothetical protein GCG54_00013740 [Colletotrichum gloeosporioides]|uniref:Uncharacterized protein n=1 Tax=Colletotrichum gloeosporioides TaxID=474922 RepID=A0A8H4FQA0_COLGL|nr:uncharacterized protein GCG54_00013740 [Colletotrichum gloeosporioides]KAF3810500.1 hypothetical protein GCG54_00013740 [Colletotrichum gloeosporioides]